MTHTLGNRLGRTAGLALLALAGSALVGTQPVQAAPAPHADPVVNHAPATPRAVKDSYIVGLKTPQNRRSLAPADVRSRAADLGARYHGRVGRRFEHAVRGFEAKMSATDAQRLGKDPSVAFVAPNSLVSLAAELPSKTDSWGLDRLDDRSVPGNFSYVAPNTAANVHAYVLDTGVMLNHTDFGGRVTSGPDYVDDDADSSDCHGHGTHVAGTIGGAKYGVAKAAQIVGLRVVNCQGGGTAEQVIAGLDWVTANAVKPAVANLSLRYDPNQAIDAAVEALVASGVTVAVAAGNERTDACSASPARTPGALTVGATNRQDRRASFSNHGACVDLFAPGEDILSSWLGSTWNPSTGTFEPGGTRYESGTSMASPHVAGVAGLVLADHPDYTPAQVHDALLANALTDKVQDAGAGSPNKLAFVGSTPRDFGLKANCSSSPVMGGRTALNTVTFEQKSSIYQWVHLSAGDLPRGVTVTFDRPDSLSNWQSPIWLTIRASEDAEPGYHPWTLTAAGSDDTHTANCSVYVRPPQFTVAAGPASLTVAAGQSATTTLSIAVTEGPSHAVTFAPDSDVPAGTTVTFAPSSVNSAGGTTTMTVTPPATLLPGTYRFGVYANGPWQYGYAYTSVAVTVTPRTDGCQVTNGTDVAFSSGGNATSTLSVTGCARQALANSTVEVHVKHPERAYVGLKLIGPDGTAYPLKESLDGYYGLNLDAQYVKDLSAKNANGTWKLVASSFVYAGTIDSWTLTV